MAIQSHKVAIEYDSDLFHANAQGIALDSKKRNALALEGWTVVSLTHDQLYHEREMDRVAQTICKHTHERHRWDSPTFHMRKHALRQQVLYGSDLTQRLFEKA